MNAMMTPTVPRKRRSRLLAALGGALLLGACGSKSPPAPTPTAPTAAESPQPATPPPAVPAPAITQASWEPDALEHLVAPIALYPDQLVGQILTASVNSQEVLDGGNWLLQNESLKGQALDAAAQKAGLGPAMRALVQFPSVVDMLCQQIDWTRQLGAAFTSDQKGVLDAVQRLRAQAAQVGNLKSTPQQTVQTKTENQKTIIEVKPANPQVIYVPQYNPQVVYTTPPPAPAPASTSGTVSTESAVVGGLLAFGVGIAVGAAIQNNNDCYPHWSSGAVYVSARPFYPPAYVYRPTYGPGFQPSYGYRNTHVNGDVNINVNNNYFNQFNKNQNLRNVNHNDISGATRNTAAVNNNWKGQSTYAGARNNPGGTRNNAQTQGLNQAAGRTANNGYAGSQNRPSQPSQPRVGGSGSTRSPAAANRAKASSYAGAARPGTTNTSANRTPAVDRGFGDSSRAGQSALGGSRDTPGRPTQALATRESTFSGANSAGGGSFARASSARGNASAGRFGGGGGGGRARAGR